MSKKIFQKYYDNYLSEKKFDSGSGGSGSDTKIASFSHILTEIIEEKDIKSIVDAGCGTMRWQKPFLETIDPVEYIGIDTCESIIRENTENFPDLTFIHAALEEADIPKNKDLIICRDVLMHLPLDITKQILIKFKESGAKYLAIGSFITRTPNQNIEIDDFYNIDITQEPFNMTDFVESYSETFCGKHIYLYSLK